MQLAVFGSIVGLQENSKSSGPQKFHSYCFRLCHENTTSTAKSRFYDFFLKWQIKTCQPLLNKIFDSKIFSSPKSSYACTLDSGIDVPLE